MVVNGSPEQYISELRSQFGWEEYVVFAIVLCASAAIGIFYGFFSRREETNEEYLLGGRKMKAWPVALSIMCSFISALTVLGNPMETYSYGTQYLTIILSVTPSALILIFLFIPVFYKLQLTSSYEYFELRFNTPIRIFLSLIHSFYLVVYMPLAVYAPSLAISQVTGFDTLLSVACIFVICIFYSTLGGFRAVIWTDVLQGVVLIVSMVVVAVQGTIDVGGFEIIWKRLEDTGRVSFFRFDPDMRTRHSVWSVSIGGLFMYLNMMGGSQANVQRFSSMPNLKTVNKSILLCCLFLIVVVFLCTYTGLVMFAKYYMCDPINANLVTTTDQILPLFMMDVVGSTPGLPGLFVAGLTCAILSSVSSQLNAVSALVVEDYILKLKPDLTDRLRFHASRGVGLICGCISFVFIFAVRLMGDIFPAAVSLIGALMGPTFGMYSLGMMFPFANSMGSSIGVTLSYAISMFLALGSSISGGLGDLPNQKCSLSIEGCTDFFTDTSSIKNVTHLIRPADIWKGIDYTGYTDFMSVSYLYFPMIATLATIVFGLMCSGIVSLLGLTKNEKPVSVDCISPPCLWLWTQICPELVAKCVSDENLRVRRKSVNEPE